MSILSKLLFWRKKNHFKVDDVRLEYAFECGGVEYFEPTDLNLFPWQRMLAATQAYNKLGLAVGEKDIRYACDVLTKLLTSEKVTMETLVNLLRWRDVLLQRLDTKFRPEELMWDVAAVVFMDKTESPYSYDPVYGQKKIAHWKKHKDVTLFFSQLPVQRLVPYIAATEQNSLIFTETIKELAKIEESAVKQSPLQSNLQKQRQALRNSQPGSSARGTSPN